MRKKFVSLLMICIMTVCAIPVIAAETEQKDEVTDVSSYIDYRNPLKHTLDKVEKNETVNVVFFGGSVTAGYGATKQDETSWRAIAGDYIKELVKQKGSTATVQTMNKAAGETGTFLGAYRTPHDIVTQNPDLLFVEYAINDSYTNSSYEDSMAQMETIVREVKTACPECDIVFVITTDSLKLLDARDGKLHENALAHIEVAKHYGISTIRVGQALASLLPEGSLTYEAVYDFWAGTDDASKEDGYAIDVSHPNDKGYAVYADVVCEFLRAEFQGENQNQKISVNVKDQTTIVSNHLFDGNRTIVYGDGSMIENSAGTLSLEQMLNQDENAVGFFYDETPTYIGGNSKYTGVLRLQKNVKGVISFAFTGTELSMFADIASGSEITYSLDGGQEKKASVGGNRPFIIFQDIQAGTHRVTLTFDWSGFKLNDSTGEYLNVSLLMFRDASRQTTGLTADGDNYLVAKDTTVSIRQLPVQTYEGKAFIGWKLGNDFVQTDSVVLQKGQKLEAVYITYGIASDDFYVEDIQMRVDKDNSLRFVLRLNWQLFEKLTAAGATLMTDEVSYGALVLPDNLTNEQELKYGETICDGNGKITGVTGTVPALKIYEEIMQNGEMSGIRYTVAVTNITGEKAVRTYKVRGYVRYIDANGNERVLYSGYADTEQSSLYQAAIRLCDDATRTDEERALGRAVVEYVEKMGFATFFDNPVETSRYLL